TSYPVMPYALRSCGGPGAHGSITKSPSSVWTRMRGRTSADVPAIDEPAEKMSPRMPPTSGMGPIVRRGGRDSQIYMVIRASAGAMIFWPHMARTAWHSRLSVCRTRTESDGESRDWAKTPRLAYGNGASFLDKDALSASHRDRRRCRAQFGGRNRPS